MTSGGSCGRVTGTVRVLPEGCMELWGGFSFTDPRVVEGNGVGISTDTENDHIKRSAAAHGQALDRPWLFRLPIWLTRGGR